MSLDIALRGELFTALQLDGKVDVRSWATRIRDGLYGAECVFASRAGQKATKPLEVCVPLVPVSTA